MLTRAVNYQLLCLRGVSKTPPGRQKYDSGMTAAAEPPRATSGAQRKVPELLDTCRVSYYWIKKRGFDRVTAFVLNGVILAIDVSPLKFDVDVPQGCPPTQKLCKYKKKKCRQIRLPKRRNSDQ